MARCRLPRCRLPRARGSAGAGPGVRLGLAVCRRVRGCRRARSRRYLMAARRRRTGRRARRAARVMAAAVPAHLPPLPPRASDWQQLPTPPHVTDQLTPPRVTDQLTPPRVTDQPSRTAASAAALSTAAPARTAPARTAWLGPPRRPLLRSRLSLACRAPGRRVPPLVTSAPVTVARAAALCSAPPRPAPLLSRRPLTLEGATAASARRASSQLPLRTARARLAGG